MRGQPGFWDLDERYQRLSAVGDPHTLAGVREAACKGAEAVRWLERRTSTVPGGADFQDSGAAGAGQSL